jgi:hypothetical protein
VVVTAVSKLKFQGIDPRSDKNLCHYSCIAKFVGSSVLSQKAHKSNGDKKSISNLYLQLELKLYSCLQTETAMYKGKSSQSFLV